MMGYKFTNFFALLILALLPLCSSAFPVSQDDKTAQEEEKKMREAIDKQIEDWENQLKLDYWQVFYVDSIMTHDYEAMRAELKSLSDAKVSNTDIYYDVQDKWMEQMYTSFGKVFDETQWAKYLKMGAARDKKARDKRAAKHK